MTDRQIPKPGEIFELMRFKKPELDARKRRLEAALTIYDLRDIARRRTPRAAFDYTDGAAEDEISLARARQAFEDVEFHPSILKDVSAADTSTTASGGAWGGPLGTPGRGVACRAPRPPAPAGFDTRFFPVAAAVDGARLRDKRNGFSIPPQLSL